MPMTLIKWYWRYNRDKMSAHHNENEIKEEEESKITNKCWTARVCVCAFSSPKNVCFLYNIFVYLMFDLVVVVGDIGIASRNQRSYLSFIWARTTNIESLRDRSVNENWMKWAFKGEAQTFKLLPYYNVIYFFHIDDEEMLWCIETWFHFSPTDFVRE